MKRIFSLILTLILLLSIIGCATPTPQIIEQTVVVPQTVVVEQTVIVPQVTVVTKEVVVTATPEPTATPEKTASVEPVSPAVAGTSEPDMIGSENLPVYDDPMLKAWCTTIKTSQGSDKAWEMPADALPALNNNGKPQLNIPSTKCTLVFTFNQPLPADAQLLVYDIYNTAWLKLPVKAVDGNANMGYAEIKHESIIDPPLWETQAKYEVKSGEQSLWSSEIVFYDKNTPNWRCVANNAPPRKDTGKCDSQIELHPWDAGWGTPGPDGWGHN
ncbi:MAG: hypothetical protein LWX83_01785 [Anaerolineae bacterium]|nr:hypothetical protein [Anaerolineae bacterium]